MRLLLEARGGEKGDMRPRMSSWTPEVEAITQVHDMLKVLVGLTIMANSKKGAKKPDTAPSPRPGTVLDKVRLESKREKHKALVKRVLPNKG